MKKFVMILMLTAFALPAQAGVLANLPSLVLAPFGGPCTDCNMGVQSVMVSTPESAGWLANWIGPSAKRAFQNGDYVVFARELYQHFNLEALSLQPELKRE